MANVKPLGNRVLIKRSKAPTSKGGIFLPETAKEKPKEGEVIAVGPGKMLEDGTVEPMTLQVGNKVLFTSYAGTEVQNDQNEEEELLVMNENDVLAVIN